MSASRRALLGLAPAVVLPAALLALPTPEGLSLQGHRTAVLFAAMLLLWVTEALPIGITALLAVVLQAVAGLAALPAAFGAFISPVFFFVLVMFVIAQAFSTTGLDRRLAYWLLARSRGSTRQTVLLFMIGTATLSTIVSDVPTCAVFMAIALGLFDKMGLAPGRSQFARSLMIGIPIASFIGGVGTPAGSSVNILGLFFVEKFGGVRVPFLHWMAIGIPMVIVLTPLAARVLTWFFPPERERIEGIDFPAELAALGRVTKAEWKVLGIVGTMLTLWIASTWLPQIDVVVVAVLGAAVMFLPGVDLFRSWKDVERATAWEALLMIGGVTSLGALSASSGLAKWVVDAALGGLHEWPVPVVLAAIGAFIAVVHLVIPVNPALVAAMIPPIALLATETGQHPALYGVPVVFTASCAFLLPLDAVTLVTYSKGYYRMFDMFLPGLVLSVLWVLLLTVLVVLIGPFLGWL
jgi:sodium-dependent dicarboxylate transporter 2/3/5